MHVAHMLGETWVKLRCAARGNFSWQAQYLVSLKSSIHPSSKTVSFSKGYVEIMLCGGCSTLSASASLVRGRQKTQNIAPRTGTARSMLLRTSNCLFSSRRGSHLSGAFLNKGDINSREIAQTQRAPHTCKTYSKLWKSKRFNEMCVLGGGEISGSRCDVASSWCLACLCFLQLMVYREFFMDTMQMVVAIPLCFGSFSFVIMEFVHHWMVSCCPWTARIKILARV